MDSFFSLAVGWQILLIITVAVCIGGLAWLFNFLFKPKRITIGNTDISNEVTEKDVEKKSLVNRDIKLVLSQSVIVGFEICKMELVTVVEIQDQFADEKFEGWNLFVKDKFLDLLSTKEEYKYNDNLSTENETRLFFNVLRGFTDKCKQTLHLSFAANNFKYMTEIEFQEMIKRKTLMLEAYFEKYFTDNYFEEICTLSVAQMTRDLKDSIKDDFSKLISNIFEFARIKKNETEQAVEKKKQDLEAYVREYVNEDFKMDC